MEGTIAQLVLSREMQVGAGAGGGQGSTGAGVELGKVPLVVSQENLSQKAPAWGEV